MVVPAQRTFAVAAGSTPARTGAVRIGAAVTPVVSPPLRQAAPFVGPGPLGKAAPAETGDEGGESSEVPNRRLPHPPSPAAATGGGQARPPSEDPVIQRTFGSGRSVPTPAGVSFDGIGAAGLAPPDANGRVGPNHFVQWVNTRLAVYDKTGGLLFGPVAGNSLFAALGGPCASTNQGDPIGQYDPLADRWVLTQFVVNQAIPAASHQCYAVSVTGDPLGSYYLYDFVTGAAEFVDYPHVGIWPDGYYETSHVFDYPATHYVGQGLHVFERQRMLVGAPARMMFVNLGLGYGGALAADVDGLVPPPAGSPEYVVAAGSPELDGSASPVLHVWRAAVTWGPAPTLSMTGPADVPTAAFNGDLCGFDRACISQPPPAAAGDAVDAVSDRVLYRLAYRNRGGAESLVANHTVNVAAAAGHASNQAGVRWYELQSLSPAQIPTIVQQGTFAPDGKQRWMGSIAMDASGDLALGYSLSDASSTKPSIAVTGRLASDPPGVMGAETTMFSGAGSQLGTGNRWGDYSAMTVDARDGCTFWYTNEYLAGDGSYNWKTRVAAFRFPSCSSPPKATISGTVTDCASGLPVAGAVVIVDEGTGHSAATDAAGHYSIVLPPGAYVVSARRGECGSSGSSSVSLADGGAATRDFCVPSGPGYRLGTATIDDSLGNGDGRINRDECIRLTLPLVNVGCSAATSVTATLTSGTPGVAVTVPSASYPDIAVGSTQSASAPFQISTASGFPCGTPIALVLGVTASGVTRQVPFALTSCELPAVVFSGSIDDTDFAQTGRLAQASPLGTCDGKPCPGTIAGDTAPRHFDLHTVTNTSSTDRCLTILTSTACGGASSVFPVAYVGGFDPANLCAHYAGDPVVPPLTTNEFYVDLPAGETMWLVVHELTPDAGCASYTVSVYGLLDGASGGGGNDLSVSTAASAEPVLAGSDVTYTVTVRNDGGSTAAGVVLADTLPAGTPVSVTPSVGSCSGSAVRTCSLGSLAPGATATVAIVMTAPGSPGTVTNLAAVSAAGCDPNASNDSSSLSTSVVGATSPAALFVDAAASAGTVSNANGLLEPGETVVVRPSWRNNTSAPSSPFTGAGSGPTGPAGAVYGLPDASASYGGAGAGSAGDCGSDCYLFSASNPGTRPAAHWDASFSETLSSSPAKSWLLHVGRSFSDVPSSDGRYPFVETIFHKGVTGGCGPALFCPNEPVTRRQAAVFLLVSVHGPGYAPPAAAGIFWDVPAADPFARFVERLYAEEITGGCGAAPLRYCPGDPVTRAQMAVFLLRAEHGAAYVPPPATGVFSDVPASSGFAPWVEQLFHEGITAGCGGGLYCPDSPNTRGQMAVFLTETFRLALYGP